MNDQLAHIASHAQEHAQDPMVKPLTKGEVIIFYYPSHTREVAKEADFTLVDRALDLGDVVKRTTKDTQSGVVIGIDASARLAHAISGAKLPGWVSTNEIEAAFPASVGSLVVYNNWVGQVNLELFITLSAVLTITQIIEV
jgi:ubiquitin-conjugating enzyme E2 O